MKLLHITIQTSHFPEELAFYEKYTSLSIMKDMRPMGRNMLFLADKEGDTEIELIENPEAADSGNAHLSVGFSADDPEALREKLEEDGFKPTPFITPMPQVKFFFVKDPAGVRVQFMKSAKTQDSFEKQAGSMAFALGGTNAEFGKHFSGPTYLALLSKEQQNVFNVTFEPGVKSVWHVHTAKSGGGHILLCLSGKGMYQEWGKEPVELHPGDVVNTAANVKHWHGAAEDSWFTHIAIEVPGEETGIEWCEPV